MLMIPFLIAGLTAAEGGGIPGPVTTVEEWRGLPTFLIDGEPHMPTSFETYVPKVRYFRQMSEAGADVFGFPANCGEAPYWHSTPTWVGPDVWDFSEFDENVGKVLEANPDAYIMPRINVSEPEWWRDRNPAELMVFHDGTADMRRPFRLWPEKESRTVASMASEKWRREMADSLRRLIDHIHASPYADRIFAYQIYGQATEEWYHYTMGRPQMGDYSTHTHAAFGRWLQERYGGDYQFKRAWNGRHDSIALAEVPDRERRLAGRGERAFRDPRTERDVIDWYHFWNEIIPDTIDYFCGVVKEATNNTKAVGAFYAFMFEFSGRQDSGHLGVQKLLQSENVDYIVVTASYGMRQLGSGGSILRSPHTSLRLHGKLWYEDNDTVSFLFPEVSQRMGDAEWERSKVVLAATDTAEESRWIYERGAGFVLGNGIYQAIFDLHGGYFDDPELLEAMSGIYRVFDESAKYDRTSVSEILVVADERSAFYCTLDSALLRQSLYDPPYRLIKCGAPYDSVYLNDLALLDMSPYKLIIVLNAYCMDDAQRRLIDETLRRPGQTVLWVHAPGLFTVDRRLPGGMEHVTGIKFAQHGPDGLAPSRMELVPQAGRFTERLAAQDITAVGPAEPAGPLFHVTDEDAVILGRDVESGLVTLASKEINGTMHIYTRTASLPPAFFRELARDAGVHLYSEADDTLYVSRSYVTINADGAGERVLRFPEPMDVWNPKTDERLAENTTEYRPTLRDKETLMLRVSPVNGREE